MNYLPGKLLKLRKHYNYSQSYLAEVLGMETLDYMAIENGRQMINYAQCKKLANLYHINVLEIFRNDSEVTLYKVDDATTDALNIEYFLPKKSFIEKLSDYIKANSIKVLILALLILIVSVLFVLNGSNVTNEDYSLSLENINRLSVSDTTVVYIDSDGSVKGTGDNSNGQISSLNSSNAIKVSEGSTYTIILNKDMSVTSIGLASKYAEEISDWKNIVDIASGDNHVLGVDIRGKVYCVGDNGSGQCNIENYTKIKKVFATASGSILLDEDGKLYYEGDFIGTSQIKNLSNILDIDTSNDNMVILTSDNKVEYVASKKNFLDIYKWENVIDVACGNDFIAGLKDDGSVYVDCDNKDFEDEVSSWRNIIAIAAADEYIIGYDGTSIYGAGENDYLQFNQDKNDLAALAQVHGVNISFEENNVNVSFDKVTNATAYEIVLITGGDNNQTYRVSSNQTVSFSGDGLEDGATYQISITTLGDNENYLSSKALVIDFVYEKQNIEDDGYVDVSFNYLEMTPDELIAYLDSIGINRDNVIGKEDENNECVEANRQLVTYVNGISSGQRYSKKTLSDAKVSYGYCKLKVEEEIEDPGETNE